MIRSTKNSSQLEYNVLRLSKIVFLVAISLASPLTVQAQQTHSSVKVSYKDAQREIEPFKKFPKLYETLLKLQKRYVLNSNLLSILAEQNKSIGSTEAQASLTTLPLLVTELVGGVRLIGGREMWKESSAIWNFYGGVALPVGGVVVVASEWYESQVNPLGRLADPSSDAQLNRRVFAIERTLEQNMKIFDDAYRVSFERYHVLSQEHPSGLQVWLNSIFLGEALYHTKLKGSIRELAAILQYENLYIKQSKAKLIELFENRILF